MNIQTFINQLRINREQRKEGVLASDKAYVMLDMLQQMQNDLPHDHKTAVYCPVCFAPTYPFKHAGEVQYICVQPHLTKDNKNGH